MTGAERVVRGDAERETAVDDAELLDDVNVINVRQSRAAVLLGDRHAQHAEAAGTLENLGGKVLRLIPLHQMRLDLAERELAHHLLNLSLLVGKTEIHSHSSRSVSPGRAGRAPHRRRRDDSRGGGACGYQQQALHLAQAQTRVSVPHRSLPFPVLRRYLAAGVAQTLLSVLVRLGRLV